MTFARGFKSECERLVAQLREELALSPFAPLDMGLVAKHLEIPVFPLAHFVELAGLNRTALHLDEIYGNVSALTYFVGSHRTILFNDEHAPARHRSDMAHELAHALLCHPPDDAELTRAQHKLHEKEAAWLSGVMMLTATQARTIVASGWSFPEALDHYLLSPEMLRFRLNVTGAAKRSAAF